MSNRHVDAEELGTGVNGTFFQVFLSISLSVHLFLFDGEQEKE